MHFLDKLYIELRQKHSIKPDVFVEKSSLSTDILDLCEHWNFVDPFKNSTAYVDSLKKEMNEMMYKSLILSAPPVLIGKDEFEFMSMSYKYKPKSSDFIYSPITNFKILK